MTNLIQALANIRSESSWGIWAKSTDPTETQWRYGQTQFDNGGVLDDFQFIGNGVEIQNHIWWYCDGFENCPEGDENDWALEGAEHYLKDVDYLMNVGEKGVN